MALSIIYDLFRLVKGRLEDLNLPEKKFDVIVSEWMGYFLLFENMLDSVIDARQKYLSEGGTLLPNRSTMHLAAVSGKPNPIKTLYVLYSTY